MTDQTDMGDERHQQLLPVTSDHRGLGHLLAEGVMAAGFARARWPELVPVADLRLPLATVEPEQRGDPIPESGGVRRVTVTGLRVPEPQFPTSRNSTGVPAAVEPRPVVLIRYRAGVTGETARTVHVVPLPTDSQAGLVGALCGAALMLADIETVTPGEGMPCTLCVLIHVRGTAVAAEPPASPDSVDAARIVAGGACYHEWDWPVIVHRD